MDFFDATNIPPVQAGGAHPIGIFDAVVSGTEAKSTKDGLNGMFVVTFQTPAGTISNRYNLWNNSPQAVEIAQKQLSALCHVTNIYRISFPKNSDGSPNMAMAGHELRNARLKIDVVPQLDKERKETGYVEVKRVLDTNGNEPGGKPNPAPQPQQQQTNAAQPQGWNTPGTTNPNPNPNPNQAPTGPQIQNWGPQAQPNPAPQANQPQQGWQQNQPQQGVIPPAPWTRT